MSPCTARTWDSARLLQGRARLSAQLCEPSPANLARARLGSQAISRASLVPGWPCQGRHGIAGPIVQVGAES